MRPGVPTSTSIMVWRVTAALHPLHDGTSSPDRLDNLLIDPAGAAVVVVDSLAAVGIDDGSAG